MNYIILDQTLHTTADEAAKFFRAERGITRPFEIEKPVLNIEGLRPTLSVLGPDFYHMCIEVRESAYHLSLDSFVLDCKNKNSPVKLYVAMPKKSLDPNFKENLRRARQNGVGVFLVDENDGEIISEALALSLTGLRRVNPKDFPPKYRFAVNEAETIFHDGHPHKACSILFDEIESLTRKIAEKTFKNGNWKTLGPGRGGRAPRFYKGNWAVLLDQLIKELNVKACGCPDLNTTLLSRILGMTPHRNDSGHKPKSQADLQRRDKELRTRFEHAYDALRDLVKASKPLRV
jgi:hypothetical protein